jgi:hypothetical protein
MELILQEKLQTKDVVQTNMGGITKIYVLEALNLKK